MIESIKITNLNNIGSNLSYTSIFPVVDMSGTPVTDKANLQIIGNYILSQAGGANFVQAAQATLAQTVVNAAQPNITSVGTLTSLAVSGNANITGNLNIAVGSLKIPGGTNGYVLQTDGTGNLTWTAQTGGGGGNGSPGGSNTQVQFNDAGSFGGDFGLTYNKTTDTLTAVNINAANVDLTGNVNANWVIGDYISGNAHNLFYIPGANINGTVPSATTAGTVTTAAQPNITSVGTLSNLSVTGNVTAGNVVTSNIKSAGNINVTANVLTWLFDNQGALHWPGGIGQIDTNNSTFEIHSINGLQISTNEANSSQSFLFATDGSVYCPANAYFEGTRLNVGPGAGNVPLATNPTLVVTDTGLEFIQAALINQSPNGSSDYAAYGADSDETQGFADLGFAGHTFNDPNYTITNPGDGYVLSQGYANGIGGALVLATGQYGNTPDIVFATGGYLSSNEFARIDHANNVFHLTRANSGIKFADGTTQTTAYTGTGAASELVNGNNSFVLDSAGNVVFEGTPSGNAVDRGLVWDYGANANGVNSQIRQDLNGLTVRAWTEDSGNYTAPVNIITGQDANAKTWTFDGQGNLTVPSGSINSIDSVGELGAYITLNPNIGLAKLAGRNALSNVNYTNTSWSTATYTSTQIDFTNAPDLVAFFNDNSFNVGVNQTISINGDESIPFTGYSTGASNAVTVYTSATASPDPTTVTSIDFYWQSESYVSVDYDAGTLNINATGLTINLDNDQTSGPDINLRSGDDILLQGKDKALGSESEGGDINIYAGDGASDDGNGNVSSSGGDIQIVGGQGGFGNSGSGSSGGFARFQGGDGGDAGVGTTAGSGGFVQINAGDGGYNGGNAQLGSLGGYVEIYAGQTTLADGVGGYVDISSGTAADGNGIAGNVRIRTPISATGQGGNWTYDGQGNLTLPNGNPYIKTSDEESTITISVAGAANNRSQFEIGSDGGTDQYTYISSQNDTNGFASFGLNAPNGVPTSAVIGINNGTALDWTFTSAALDDTEAYLYTPAGATITTPNAPTGQTGKNIFIEAGSVDQENYNTNTGGELMLKGGRGGFNDGGGGGPGGNVNINAGESADPAGHAGNVNITAGALTNWTFDYTGNLTLPANTFSVNYANGDPVTFGAAALGNVTFDNVTVQGVNGLNLSAGSDFTANLAYLQVRAGDVASHIHLDTGNNSAYDLILGDDQNYVQVSSTGNILLSAYDSNTAQYTWTLDYNGNLILAGGNSVIQSIANSSLDPLNPNVSTMVLTPDQGYNSQALVLDPTAPGHIHLRAPGANIDEPSANIFLGGEESSFEVGYYTGSAPNVFVHSGNNTWTFDNSGSLSFPRDAGGGTDPYLVINGGTTPAINSVDASLAGPANLQISSDYLSMSGYTGATVTVRADDGEIATDANMVLTTNNANVGNEFSWTFDDTGNLTLPGNTFAVNYANGTQVSLGGGYGDSNVVSLLSSFGSNTISTTGNISTGAVTATGKIGYSTGGTVTQTGTGQGVTLNQLTGEITLAKSSWTAGDIEVFILQTNKVSTGDYIMAQTINSVYATSFNVNAWVYPLLANSVQIYVRALESVTSTPIVKFLIMKAATS